MIPGQPQHKLQLFALLTAVVALAALLCAGRVAELVIVSFLFAYILDPVVTALEDRGLSRGGASAAVMCVLLLLFAVFWYTVIPIAIDQFKALQAGGDVSPAAKIIARLEASLREHGGVLGMAEINLGEKLAALKASLVQKVPLFLMKGSLSIILSLIMTPFIMFFVLKDGQLMKKYFISMVPNRYFEFSMDLLYKMDAQLGSYLRGQFTDAVVFGILATASLWLLNVPYFVFIGVFAGLANLVPVVGPVAGAAAAFVVVLFEQGDIVRGAYVLAVFTLLKLVDDVVIQPIAVGKNVHLHPMVVALAIMIGGRLFGILGMLLVVPTVGFLKVVLEESIATFRRYRFD